MQTAKVCIGSLLLALICPGAVHAQNVKLGKEIFTDTAAPSCALCHTLKDAQASGEIGPNLDELKPDKEKIRRAVKNGVGNMPPYGEALSDAEIAAVAGYVAGAAGR